MLEGDDEQTVVVSVNSSDTGANLSASDTTALSVSQLEDRANTAQAPLNQYAAETAGVTVENNVWLGNVAIVTIDHAQADPEALAAVDGVEHVRPNFEVPIDTTVAETAAGEPTQAQPTPAVDPDIDQTAAGATYGLEQINAPDVWDGYNADGNETTVAVLDTGVDPDHPDITLEKWGEWDENGTELNTEPSDSNGHGTHVSGTVAGGDASGTHIGVAPGVELHHGAVVADDGTATFSQIVAGMEWAVDNDVDVLSMSLGTENYADGFIQPIRDAQGAGTMVIAAAGNSDEGTSESPGNVYDATSVGASNEDEEIATFSSGETVERDDWDDPPADWPDEYVVPTVSAPGVSVESSVPDGGYDTQSGTSMATPHVSGAVALLQSATVDDLSIAEIEKALTETATKPDGEDETQDTRYGHGIIDVKAAVDSLSDEEPDQAQFDVSIDATNSPVSEGETLEVNVTVVNGGEKTDTQQISLETDDDQRDSAEVTLESEETRTVSLEWMTDTDDAGDYSATVASDDDTDSVGVTVLEPASFAVSILETNSPVIAGETLTIDASVENTGEATDTQTVLLVTDSTERAGSNVTLAGGKATTVTLEWETAADDDGTYTGTVTSDDDTASVSISIESTEASVEDYTNEDDVVETDGLRMAISDWRSGEIETDLLRDVIRAWRSGEPVE